MLLGLRRVGQACALGWNSVRLAPSPRPLDQNYESGNNRFERTEEVDGPSQDGGPATRTTPDVEKFRTAMARVAKHMSQAGGYLNGDPKKQAEAEQTRAQTDLAGRAATDPNAARGALYMSGKGEFGERGTSHVTGAAAPNSVAASEITENTAQAGKYAAEANGSVSDIKMLETERKNIDQDITGSRDLIRQAREALKKLPDAEEEKGLRATIATQEARIASAQRRRDALSERISTMGRGGGGGGGGNPPAGALAEPPEPSRPKPAAAPGAPAAPAAPSSPASEVARAEAVSDRTEVKFDLKGRQGSFGPDGKETPAAAGNVPEPKTKAEYDALPKGTVYIRDGKRYRKG